ncbi:hypothetical protein PDJAM_G00260380 [Pangasius djambal]|nr:hypothetical protein [Pangasius djambal]
MIGIARRILDSMFLQLKDKLTHEVLVTFMAEVAASINARPIVPVTTDPDESFILTPAALLTQKVNYVAPPAGEFGVADLYMSQWRQVQQLSNTFWDRWRKQFLPTLQTRKKWQSSHPNPSLLVFVVFSFGNIICINTLQKDCGVLVVILCPLQTRTRRVDV